MQRMLQLPDSTIDRYLDAVLRASGSALRNYTMPSKLNEMRQTLRVAFADSVPFHWVSLTERHPERNATVVYWHKSEEGGFWAIADEWRDEHHAEFADYWLDIDPPGCVRQGPADCTAFHNASFFGAQPRSRALEPDDGA